MHEPEQAGSQTEAWGGGIPRTVAKQGPPVSPTRTRGELLPSGRGCCQEFEIECLRSMLFLLAA